MRSITVTVEGFKKPKDSDFGTPDVVAFKKGIGSTKKYLSANGLDRPTIRKFFKTLPTTPYNVTYRLNEKGGYTVCKVYDHYIGISSGKKVIAVCFLPRAWIGKKVTRVVRVLK